MPVTPESAEKKAIKEWLAINGWFHFHLLAGVGTYPGAPDIIAVKNGRAVAIEVKAGKGKQSPHQVNFQVDWELHGGTYICGGIDEVMLRLR